MILVLSYRPDPDPELTKYVETLAQGRRVTTFSKYAEALDAICKGRFQGKPEGPVHEPVTHVIVDNYPAPTGSEPSPMKAVRHLGGWSMRGRERVLEVSIFPEPSFPRENRDSDRPRWRHTAVPLT